jgi:hypothetical protein
MSNSRAPLVLGGALLVVAAAAIWFMRPRPAPPAPAPPVTAAVVPSPEPYATPPMPEEPSPTPEPAPVTVATGPRKKTPPKPTTRTKALDSAAVAEAMRQGKYDEAIRLYEEAAGSDPKINEITRSLRRRFLPGLTQSWSTKGVSSKLEGFDAGNVDVKRVPENDGRLDFVVVPPRVRPGDAYRVDVHLTNGGKKPIRIAGVTAVTSADGRKEGGAVQSLDKREIATLQRERVATVNGVWPEELQAWSLEVNVSAKNGDAYHSSLKWE